MLQPLPLQQVRVLRVVADQVGQGGELAAADVEVAVHGRDAVGRPGDEVVRDADRRDV